MNNNLMTYLSDFHFLRPELLWFLLPVIVVTIIALVSLREQVSWKKTIASHLRKYVISKGSESRRKLIQLGLSLFLSLAILGAAGPTWKRVQMPGSILETPMVIILNMSPSMLKSDIQPNRIERSKFKLNDLLVASPGARIAMVGFSGSAHTIVPLTRDYNILSSHINSLSPDIMPVEGNNLSAALEMTDTILLNISAPSKIIIFSDTFDEDVADLLLNYSSVNDHNITIYPVISEQNMDKNSLNRLSAADNITLAMMTLDKSDMELIAKTTRENLRFKESDTEKEDDWIDMGFWFMIPFAIYILFWFRKGWVIYSIAFMIITTSCSGDLKFKDLWYTKDYQGQQSYDKGDYEAATGLFSDPLHKGVAYYKNGDFEQAIEELKKDSSAAGSYNLGLAYIKSGNYAAAAIAMSDAVEKDPDLTIAADKRDVLQQIIESNDEVTQEQAQEAEEAEANKNIENKDMEDLGGGGQEATKEDMQKERKEETVSTDIRKGEELEEVPEDFESGRSDMSQKVMMRKVDDDPALFLKRKFKYQLKQRSKEKEKNQ